MVFCDKVSKSTTVTSFHGGALLLVLLFGFGVCSGQAVPSQELERLTDSIIVNAPTTYGELNAILRPVRRDTFAMRYVAQAAHNKEYWDGETYALNQLGITYRNLSRYTKALEIHNQALDAAVRAGNMEFRVFSLNMLGVVYRRMDAIKSAMEYNQEALELAESVREPSLGLRRSINVSLNSIGNIYVTLRQYNLAIETFKRSLVLEEELGNTLGQAVNHENIGECYEELGDLNSALASYEKSMALNKAIASDRGIAICDNAIGRVYVKLGKVAQAIPMLERALESAGTLGDNYLGAMVHVNLGWALMEQGDFVRAGALLEEGLDLAQKFKIPTAQIEAYEVLSQLGAAQGNFEKSMEYYKKGVAIEKEIVSERNLRYVNDIIIRYDAEKKSSQIKMLAQENEIVKLKLRKNQILFLIGGLAFLLMAGILYILYRQNQLKQDKKMISLEQRMLRSQMNPHFLFNSLNSIKHYIINNEQRNAVQYLNKFSKLIRKILEASTFKEISLAEELETVRLYMNIENIRFSQEIDFSISVSPEIQADSIKVPSLILQPFLENALWHGLSTKEGSKVVQLNVVQEENGYIQISITDNGVGREASEKIKAHKILKRKSVGIAITKERLANFSKAFKNPFKMVLADLFDDSGNPTGTRVELYIPTL